jgi:hypothetical protein
MYYLEVIWIEIIMGIIYIPVSAVQKSFCKFCLYFNLGLNARLPERRLLHIAVEVLHTSLGRSQSPSGFCECFQINVLTPVLKTHQLPFQPIHSTKNYILTIIYTTEEQKNATAFPIKITTTTTTTTTTHATQPNRTETQRPHNYPTHNIEPQQLTKPRETTVPRPTASFKEVIQQK